MASPGPIAQVLPLNLLPSSVEKQETDKIWDGKISVTASTEGFWEIDREFQLKSHIDKLKRKFHETRFLKVKFLPTSVSEKKIHQMLSDFPVARIEINRKPDSAGNAHVFLEDPEMFEEWDKNRTFMLRGRRIPVYPTPSENWVCVARLPLCLTETDFYELVKLFGDVKNYIYMISEKTGESKGYGLVDYFSREKAKIAMAKLRDLKHSDLPLLNFSNNNGSEFECDPNAHIWADMIHSSCITFESLHSRCLHISNLPPNYKDMGEFRKILSQVAQPPYCQIAMKNGVPLSWGLVEYNSGEDAELTFNKLNGKMLRDQPLRIAYYIPGVRAIHLYGKLLAEEEKKLPAPAGKGLLPDPPVPVIYQAVKKLRKQNPVFAMNVEHILAAQRLKKEKSASGDSSDTESGDNAVQSKKTKWSTKRKSRTPSPKIDEPPAQNASPTLLPTPDDTPPKTSPEKNPRAAFPINAEAFMNQATLHNMMVSAQNFGNDSNPVVPEVMPFTGSFTFGSHIPMLPVGYIPFGSVSAPGMFPLAMPVVPQQIEVPVNDAEAAASQLTTPDASNVQKPTINLLINQQIHNIHQTVPIAMGSVPPGFEKPMTPPKNLELRLDTPNSEPSLSPDSKKIDEALRVSGICNIWGPKEVTTPIYNRLGPNGLIEKVTTPYGGIWTPNISPPTIKRRANVWPIYDFMAVSQSKRPRN